MHVKITAWKTDRRLKSFLNYEIEHDVTLYLHERFPELTLSPALANVVPRRCRILDPDWPVIADMEKSSVRRRKAVAFSHLQDRGVYSLFFKRKTINEAGEGTTVFSKKRIAVSHLSESSRDIRTA